MRGRRGGVALIGLSLALLVVAVIGWWRVASLRANLDEARSEEAGERGKTSDLTEALEGTRDDLRRVKDGLARARRRAGDAGAETRAMQGCIGTVADEDEAGPQAVVFGFLRVVEGRQVLIDEAEWYVGDEANREALGDGEIELGDSVPNDYYIRNDDSSHTSLGVAQSVVVVTSTADRHNIPAPKCKSRGQFTASFVGSKPWETSLRRSPYWLTVRKGEVVRIVEQYLP